MSSINWIYLPETNSYLNIDKADLIKEFRDESNKRYVQVSYFNDTIREYYGKDAEAIICHVRGLLEISA